MVSYKTLICLTVFAVSFATAYVLPNYDAIPEQFRDVIPEEVKNFYTSLTEEDKAVIVDWAKGHEGYATEDEALQALKGKSENLYEKAMAAKDLLLSRINALKPEAKEFLTSTYETLKSLRPATGTKPDIALIKKTAMSVYEKFNALSEEAKEDLKTQFPKTAAILQNEKIQKLAKGFIESN
ncbi:Nematode fatty acid retinoid binding family-containing protein [Strongyloides ratti]|uniref:Fatty-acid and retinol-binding protein 1 n=1 Tax=Strongyloides ratti TaxID=34506 RepID=A0A090LES6_STRRB|nr:Nematode fatty acid retinoid binding family-containing protein [Strongyloides ratti]CEF68237.1 Nematode fatty acid retinoid binding family-containing protein [Strongyloides ratti]